MGGELANFFRIIQIILIGITLIGVLFGLRHNVANLTLVDGVLNQDDEMLDAARQQLEGVTTHRTADWLAFLYFEQGAFDDALVQFEQALADGNGHSIYSPETSEYWFLQGMWSAKHEDWDAAVLAYRTAFALHPQVWDVGLYQQYDVALMTSSGKGDSAEFTPPIPITTTVCPEIIAIQYDRTAIAVGPHIPIILHHADGSSTQFQVINLVPNAGFEWGERDGRPVGFEKTIYTQDNISDTHRLINADTPHNPNTTVATLINNEQSNKSSYQSFAIEIEPSVFYFLGGWAANIGSVAPIDLGVGWYGRGLPDMNPYHFLSIPPSDVWQFVADIVPMPQSADVDIVLVNQNETSGSRASFDDLFFFQIDPLTCTPIEAIRY